MPPEALKSGARLVAVAVDDQSVFLAVPDAGVRTTEASYRLKSRVVNEAVKCLGEQAGEGKALNVPSPVGSCAVLDRHPVDTHPALVRKAVRETLPVCAEHLHLLRRRCSRKSYGPHAIEGLSDLGTVGLCN